MMVEGIHHVSVVTADAKRLIAFLEQVLGMVVTATIDTERTQIAELLGWPEREGLVRSVILGSGRAGLLEVIDCPGATERAASDPPAAGVLQLAVSVRDLAVALREARALGVDEIVGPRELAVAGHRILAAVVGVAGSRFQLVETIS
jgi:catechol 2,3-dioxygenase-like lactoylglutathione lyase family enzyme